MDIRSITLFADADAQPATFAPFLREARHAFPLNVQTLRLATPPFPTWLPADDDHMEATAANFAQTWQDAGIDYISFGPVQLTHDATWLDRIPTLIAAADPIFASAAISDLAGNVDVGRCHHIARIIRRNSTLQANGFGNLYFAALAHCPPGSPFFPVAYHRGGPAHFAVAVESADIALRAVRGADSLTDARQRLVAAIEQEADRIMTATAALTRQFGLPCGGIDFSLAPFPTDEHSLGGALEALGLAYIGGPGSLFAAAFVTEAINRARFPRRGFSGLMLPVLEDSVLARRAAEGHLTITDLLSYAAVCGVGLDTIPLAGDVREGEIAGILLDLAALSARLRKPLTARLMPLPGLSAGDPVTFDFPYFAGSRVMPSPGPGVSGLLAHPTRLQMQHRIEWSVDSG